MKSESALIRLIVERLDHRGRLLAGILVATAIAAPLAALVKPDYSVELLFPTGNERHATYTRYHEDFPIDDALALVVIEDSQQSIKIEGPVSLRNDLAEADGVAAVLAPIHAPDGGTALTFPVLFEAAAVAEDSGRQNVLDELNAISLRHEKSAGPITLSGIPIIRAEFARMISHDVNLLVPIALLGALVLLLITFRSIGVVLAGMATIVASLIWSFGLAGLAGFDLTLLVSVTPIIVIVVSMSDTVHISNSFLDARNGGLGPRDAASEALRHSALPCLLTEVVVAVGFLALGAIRIPGITQFGIITATAMLCTWIANVTVLPLILSVLKPARIGQAKSEGTHARGVIVAWLEAGLARLSVINDRHPIRVVLIVGLAIGAAGIAASQVQRGAFAFDDLRADSRLLHDIRIAEDATGGIIPVAIYIEVANGDTDGAGLAKAGEARLEDVPEIADAITLRSADGNSIAVIAGVPDVGSARAGEIVDELEAWVASENSSVPRDAQLSASLTGQLRIFDDVNKMLLRGLAMSLSLSVIVSFAAMCLVLRSWRLGLIGLIPNIIPLVAVAGFMGITGIRLNASTIILFSITLVIAEDDTIQFLSRFREHLNVAWAQGLARPLAQRQASAATLREVGLPMVVTSLSISVGFLALLGSSFLGPAHLGMLLAATLSIAAIFDLTLTPVLAGRLPLMKPSQNSDPEPTCAP